MKKYFTLLFSLICFSLFSQEEEKNYLSSKNEIKVDFFNLLALGKFSISYERLFNDKLSVGISTLKTAPNYMDKRLDVYNNNKALSLQIIPYLRYNFSNKNNKRFYYIEFFSAYNDGEFYQLSRLSDGQYAYYDITKKSFSDMAVGGSLGLKKYLNNSLVLDFNIGLGRNILNNDSQEVLPRVGLNLGYKF